MVQERLEELKLAAKPREEPKPAKIPTSEEVLDSLSIDAILAYALTRTLT